MSIFSNKQSPKNAEQTQRLLVQGQQWQQMAEALNSAFSPVMVSDERNINAVNQNEISGLNVRG